MRKIREFFEDHVYLFFVYLTAFIVWTVLFAKPVHAETREQIEQKVRIAALNHGVDPDLAVAIAEVESHFNPNAIGTHGEIGIFQLHPQFHHVVKGHIDQNINLAMRYLARLKIRCHNYGDAYFVCYNYGTTHKLKHPRKFPYYVKVKAVEEHRRLDVARN